MYLHIKKVIVIFKDNYPTVVLNGNTIQNATLRNKELPIKTLSRFLVISSLSLIHQPPSKSHKESQHEHYKLHRWAHQNQPITTLSLPTPWHHHMETHCKVVPRKGMINLFIWSFIKFALIKYQITLILKLRNTD